MRQTHKITWAALAALLLALGAAPAVHADTTELGLRDILAQQRQRQAALQAAEIWTDLRPDRYRQLVPPGASLEPQAVPIEITLRDGSTKKVVADSLLYTLLDIGHGELKSRDRAHLGRLYAGLWHDFPTEYRQGLPRPQRVVRQSAAQIISALDQIGDRLHTHFDDIRRLISGTVAIPGLSGNPLGLCNNEVGWEAGGSHNESSARCAVGDYESLGLMKNLDWVLKDDLTCVKDQDARGTCVAHAVAANFETMIQVQGGVPENLSEQDLYFWGEVHTDFGDRFQDGLNSAEVYDALDAHNFEVQYEYSWNYNRSPDRTTDEPNANNVYPGSCNLAEYTGEMCTEYAFQGIETLTPPFLYTWTHPARAATGWEMLNWTSIPVLMLPLNSSFHIDAAIVKLESEYPVHVGLNVTDSFKRPDGGYVQHDPGDPPPSGKHAVLAVGFIANADLPAGVAPDPDGRGYFVMKNSWGTNYADCGFVYVSTEYLREWGTHFSYLDKTLSFN